MMLYSASLKYSVGSSYKYNDVASIVRGKDVKFAAQQLENSKRLHASYILKLLNSCVSNAVNNFKQDPSNLYIYRLEVSKSRTLKRSTPRGRGRMTRIEKRMTSVKIFLARKEDVLK